MFNKTIDRALTMTQLKTTDKRLYAHSNTIKHIHAIIINRQTSWCIGVIYTFINDVHYYSVF